MPGGAKRSSGRFPAPAGAPYVLGIDIGAGRVKSVIRRAGGGESPPPVSDPAVLKIGEDATVVIGEAAEDSGPAERDRVARGFARRLGDTVPFVLGGTAYPAHDLIATVVSWVAGRAARQTGAKPAHIGLAQPSGWGPHQTALLRSALDRSGVGRVTLVPDLAAAALGYAAEHGADDLIAVCDLGVSGYRAAVLRRSGATAFTPLAHPESTEPAEGADPGEAVFAQVSSELGDGLDRVDPTAPGIWQAALALRRQCAAAVDTVLSQPRTVIPVSLPELRTTVAITRDQLEEKVAPAAKKGAELLRRALRVAGVDPGSLGVIVLVGGPARIPLVARMISAELRLPAVVAPNPDATIAQGAAAAATQVTWPGALSLARAPGRELARAGRVPGPPARRDEDAVIETTVLFTGGSETEIHHYRVPDLAELSDEMPPKPPLELSPLPFDIAHEPVGEQPIWKRLALGGGAVGGIVLVVALVAWFIFGSPFHSAPSGQQPIQTRPPTTAEVTSKATHSPAPDTPRTTESP
ncbi:Hsp70 family protein [Amycolatopsis pigmentata]|uniref:Hsp70 family protein n=1 Tax=Amycolatopsis pigmentata TaxID=450801 RepID=A0ABW5FNZ4_9PSEU